MQRRYTRRVYGLAYVCIDGDGDGNGIVGIGAPPTITEGRYPLRLIVVIALKFEI